MIKPNILNAVVIISEDNLFVAGCKKSLNTTHEDAFFGRVYGYEDFKVLTSELHKEYFSYVRVIIDEKIKNDEILAIYREIELFKQLIQFSAQVGLKECFEIIEA